jgi:hypothetical protein
MRSTLIRKGRRAWADSQAGGATVGDVARRTHLDVPGCSRPGPGCCAAFGEQAVVRLLLVGATGYKVAGADACKVHAGATLAYFPSTGGVVCSGEDERLEGILAVRVAAARVMLQCCEPGDGSSAAARSMRLS